MAIDVNAFAKAIRISVENPTGNELADATRLLAYCVAAIDKHAPNVPDAIKDVCIIQLGQYLYDAPLAERSRPQSALSNSGVRSMLAPFRVHRAGVDVEAVARATGIDRDMVIEIVNDLLPSWVEMDIVPIPVAKLSVLPQWARDNATPLPAGKLVNAPSGGMGTGTGATPAQVQLIVQALARIGNLEHFESALRTAGSFNHPRLLFNVAIAQAAYRAAGNLTWPADNSDQEIKVSVNPTPSGTTATYTFDLTTLLALPSVLPSTTLTSSNALSFKPSDDSETYYLGRSGNEILFTAGSVGSYYVAFTDTEIDLASWARESNSDPIPANKLTNAPGGLNQAAVDARVRAGVSDWAEQGNATAIPANKLTNAPAGSGGGLNQAAVDARVTTLVPSWARSTERFTNKQQEVFNAFDGDDVWGIGASRVGVRMLYSSAQTVIDRLPWYGSSYNNTGPAKDPAYTVVRVPIEKVPFVELGFLRLVSIGSLGDVSIVRNSATDSSNANAISTGWNKITESDATAEYYNVGPFFAPTGERLEVHEFRPFTFDYDRISNPPASWALKGNTDKIPKDKITVLDRVVTERADTTAGIALGSVTANHRTTLTAFTKPFTLNSDLHGLLLIGIQFHVAAGSTAHFALGTGDTEFQKDIAFHQLYDLSNFQSLGAITSSNANKIGEVDIYNVVSNQRGTTKYGTVAFYLVRDGTGQVGYIFDYVSSVTGVTAAGTISANIEVFTLPSGSRSPRAPGANLTYETIMDWREFPSIPQSHSTTITGGISETNLAKLFQQTNGIPNYSYIAINLLVYDNREYGQVDPLSGMKPRRNDYSESSMLAYPPMMTLRQFENLVGGIGSQIYLIIADPKTGTPIELRIFNNRSGSNPVGASVSIGSMPGFRISNLVNGVHYQIKIGILK